MSGSKTRSIGLNQVDEFLDKPAWQARENARRLFEMLVSEIAYGDLKSYIDAHPIDFDTFLHLLPLVAGQGVAINARVAAEVARARNSEPKEWVRLQWEHRKDKTVTKKAFAESMVLAVSEEYGLVVSSRHIVERWLRGV